MFANKTMTRHRATDLSYVVSSRVAKAKRIKLRVLAARVDHHAKG